MADEQKPDATEPTKYDEITETVLRAILANLPQAQIAQWLAGVQVKSDFNATAAGLELASHTAAKFATALAEAEASSDPAFGRLAALAVYDLLGVRVNEGAFSGRGRRDSRKSDMDAAGEAVLNVVGGGQTTLEPSDAPARKFMGTMLGFAIEGWLEGWIVELLSSVIPGVDNLQTFGELDDTLSNTLGLGRLSRRVMSPLVDATVVTPMRWQVNKTYRPELLSAGETARQVARGRWTREQGVEELARQGYSPERIEALLNGSRKFFSPADVRQFVSRGHWDETAGLQHLRDQGYEPDAAEDALRLEGLRRFEQLEGQEAAALISAYADRRIDRATFVGMLNELVQPASERALLTELAEVRRGVNVKGLSPAEARACVKAGILNVRDYRRALEEDGYEPDAVTALELLLRHELEEKAAIDELRARQAAERLAEQQARDDARARRLAELETERAIARRGSEADLERAAIRGLIPLSRLEELYAARYDGDTVGLLLELVEEQRLAYVAQQEARAAALQRGTRRNLSVGAVEAAYLDSLLTLQELRARLVAMGFDEADADVLAATAVARKAARDEALARRTEAAARAKTRSIDLGRFERLVRRGARSLAQYGALLATLGFDDGARAAMTELLELTIADDARAREERAIGEARLRSKGLSLEQFRRGVLLGAKTVADFEQFLVGQGFTADAQLVLLAELRAELEDVQAARQRREAEAAASDARRLPLADAARAARLGVITPAAYVDRVRRAGFSEEDVELQLELLLVEIAEIQAARARRDEAERLARARDLSLADVERAVKAGVRSIDDYRARAAALGFDPAAVGDLVTLLGLELGELRAARDRRGTIVRELEARNLSIAQLEEAVTKGFRTLEQFVADVEALGYGSDDAELLAALLAVDLEAKGNQGP